MSVEGSGGDDASASSWKKLVVTLSATADNGDDVGGGDYADLLFRHAVDADRSRSSSLAQLDHPSSLSTQTSTDSSGGGVRKIEERPEMEQGDEFVFDEFVDDSLLDSVDMTGVLRENKGGDGPAGVAFLQSVEPSASPTLRGLANWRDVSGIDSDQLIAKSKE